MNISDDKKNLLIRVFCIIFIGCLIVTLCIAAYKDIQERRAYYREYQSTMTSLNDSIKTLKKEVENYAKEIKSLDLERENIRKEIQVIVKENEKTDSYILNGGWDYNIKFLTDFLSSKDSVPE